MKSFYFISGLPRSGSTLLSGILKQNPDFYADIESPIQGLTGNSIDVITIGESNLTITECQRKNLMYGIFDGYYKHIEKPVIFDSCGEWTKKTNLLINNEILLFYLWPSKVWFYITLWYSQTESRLLC